MAGDFDESPQDFEERIREEERMRVLRHVWTMMHSACVIYRPFEDWSKEMLDSLK
jgi:hypothetical protein